MCEVWVGMSRRTDSIIQSIALARYRGRSISSTPWEEFGLAEGGLAVRLHGVLVLLPIASTTAYPEEILQLLRKWAMAIGVFAGHREAGEVTLLVGNAVAG